MAGWRDCGWRGDVWLGRFYLSTIQTISMNRIDLFINESPTMTDRNFAYLFRPTICHGQIQFIVAQL